MEIGYYPAGQVSNVTTVAGTVSYRNDEAERLVSQESPAGAFTYSYNPSNGLVESIQYPNGMQAWYAFDVMDRVTGIEWVGSSSNLIRSLGYGYDAAGMITNVTRETGESTAYAYDSLYRLTGENTLDSSSNQVHSAMWNYELVGNRLSKTEDGIATAYTLGQGNRLASFGSEGSVYQDAAGCVTALVFDASSRLDLAWNSQYQMTAASTNGVVAEQYSYDAAGRRVMTISGGVTNWHVYAGPHVVADLDAAGGMVRSYVWGPGIDNLLSMTTYGGTTNTYYALKDHLGSVLALTDSSGNIVESYRYDAWGRTTVYAANGSALTASAVGNRYCWQGREYSWKTGLYYFRARWYEPVTGRWLSNDPIGISGGLNQYVFCNNNPVNFRDPFGLDAEIIVGADGKVTVNVPIKFEGKGATKEVVEKFTKGIEKTWSGKQGQYDVTVKVTTPVAGGKANTITVPEGNGRAYVQGGNTGNWPAERPGWTAAHEAGHLMGLGDKYSNAGVVEGWKGNIMAEQGGKVEPRNIADVIKANPAGKGKEPYDDICK